MATRVAHSEIVDHLADSFVAAVYYCQQTGGGRPRWSRYAGIHDPSAAAAFDVEAQTLLKRSRALRHALGKACEPNGGRPDLAARAHFAELLEHELAAAPAHARRSFEALLGMNGQARPIPSTNGSRHAPSVPPDLHHGRRRALPHAEGQTTRDVKRVLLPLVLLNGIILGAMAVGPVMRAAFESPPPTAEPLGLALSAFVVWALAFIPGWLLVRFLDRRAGALWDEYVIHLHRLGLDKPGNLPPPPRTSSFYARWRDDGGLARLGLRNIYQEKFDAYYGKSVSRFGTDEDRPVRPEALFPVFLCTAILAAGWTAVLYDTSLTIGAVAAPTMLTILSFAFMGAYLYFVQALMRRYFQADLRAGAYVSGYVRIVSAMIVAAVLQASLFPQIPPEAAIATAFVIGWFPDVGLHWLLRIASRRLRGAVPSVEPAYPLNRLDGLNVWYEARLLEEGIEDLQNLATAKLVDVLLHTRVPVARLVDWVDQALLLIHLPAEPSVLEQEGATHKARALHAAEGGRAHHRHALRDGGIRSASGLLRALHPERDPEERTRLLRLLEKDGFPRAAVESLYQVINADPRLAVVINWQEGDAEARTSVRLGPLPFPDETR
jgi:hypothetical protein